MATIARRYDLNNDLLFNGKRRFGVDLAIPTVEVVPEPTAPSVKPAVMDSKIEIQLSNGHRLSGVHPGANTALRLQHV